MQDNMFRKGLVFGIILLFVGASVVPSISGGIGNVETDKKEIGTSKNVIFLGKLGDAPKPTWDIGQIWRYEVNTLNINQFGVSLNADPFNLQIEVTEKTTSLYKLSFEGVMTADISINIGDVTISGRLINTEIDGWFSIDNDDLGIKKVEFSVTGTIDRGPWHITRYIPFNVQSGVEPRNVYNFFYFPICEGETWNVPSEEFDISIIFKIKFLGLWFTIIDDTGEITIDGHTVECVGVETVNGLEAYHVQGIGDYWYSPSIENIVKLEGSLDGIEIDMEYCPLPFYFVHITDTHIGKSGADTILENAVQKINDFDPPPTFVVVSGDLVDWGCGLIGYNNFMNFINIMNNLDSNIPYYTCPGNHDSRWGCGTDHYQWYVRDELRYTEFINNILKLISMNSGHDESAFGCWSLENPFNIDWYPEGSGISGGDYNWLKNQLTTQSNLKTIMFEHHPIVSNEPYWSCDEKEDNGWNGCIWNRRIEVWNLLKDPNEDGNNDDAVKAVLNGHMHYNANYKSDTPYNPEPIAYQSNGYLSTTDPKYEDYLPLHITTGAVCESECYRLIWVGTEDEIQISEMERFNEKIRCTAWWAPILPIFNNNTIGPSGRIHVYDSNGNHIGINETGQLDFEIEGSFYSDKTMYNESEDVNYTVGEVISVLFNEQNYTYVYEAIEDSILNIETEFPIGTIGSTIVEHSHINATSGSIGKLFVDKDSIDYTLYWDDDGDGIIDREIEPTAIINPPLTPSVPSGPTSGKAGKEYTYSTSTTDSEGDQIYYLFYWGDGTDSGWLGPFDSGDTCQASHIWEERGDYQIQVKAKDIYGSVGYWSYPLTVTMPVSQQNSQQQSSSQQYSSPLFFQILERLVDRVLMTR